MSSPFPVISPLHRIIQSAFALWPKSVDVFAQPCPSRLICSIEEQFAGGRIELLDHHFGKLKLGSSSILFGLVREASVLAGQDSYSSGLAAQPNFFLVRSFVGQLPAQHSRGGAVFVKNVIFHVRMS